jgi:chromosome segregation ATPase
MLSGRDTLGHLSLTLNTARQELQRLEGDIEMTSQDVAKNRQQQAQALKRLAALRLDAIKQGDVTQRIDSADHQVAEILSARQTALAQLSRKVTDVSNALIALEADREAIHGDVDTAARVLVDREAEVQAQLDSNQAFNDQLERTRETDAVAVGAEEKAEIAAEDRRLKGEPFEQDELFMYLWNRGFGTSEYRANPLARMLDARVARKCKFKDARANYWMLLEIPKRLEDHAEQVRANADSELDALQTLENEAAKNGGVHDAQSALAELEQRQDETDGKIAEAELELRKLQTEQSEYAAGTDKFIAQCLDVLAEAMERRDVSDLTHLARATMTTEDDAIVDDLRDLRRQDTALHDTLNHNRDVHREHLQRVQELEQVRHKFKRNRYDDLRSGFDKGDLLITMMSQVLGGAVRGDALWDVLRRYQQYRDVAGAWPDFGSGGVGRSRRRGSTRKPTWHRPGAGGSSRRGGFNFPRAPRSSSKGRGGFRTGGGF